jgi:hypothetical protein
MPQGSIPLFFHSVGAPTKFSLFCRVRIAMLLLAGGILAVFLEPHSFRFIAKRGVLFQASRHGVHLHIGHTEGSIYEPLGFKDIQVVTSRAGVVSKANIASAEVSFSWRALLFQRGHGFFDRLALDQVIAEVVFQPNAKGTEPAPTPAQAQLEFQPWLPAPSRAEVSRSSITFHLGSRKVEFSGVGFTVSSLQTGTISIDQLTFTQGHFHRVFTGLKGTTALQDTQLRIADLTLSPGVLLQSVASDLGDMVRGRLQVEFEFAAFGGSLRGELLNTSLGQLPTYEVAGQFSNISVETLGAFLNVGEKTGGTIKEGKFSFRGTPHDLDNATVTTRLEATDFRWGKRQFNSLVLGATVINRRVQIPELELQQAHNSLHLKGELALPDETTPWWLSDFSFDIAARLNNLTELSALFGPQFAKTAGKMVVDGSIHGENKAYSGQLLVSGTQLAWAGVPIDLLNAGIKLDGNELQIVNLEVSHGADSVRGKGSINILGERRYQAELNASIEELAAYAPLLQKPIVPATPVGGLVVNWSGDGSTGVHSGAFSAHFRKLHFKGTPEVPATLPIDADLEGTYAPGSLSLNKCVLANEDLRLEGRLAADATTVQLEGLKLTQKKALWLEGSATLPFNLFQWWVEPSLQALAPDAPFKAQLSAKEVQLEEVAHLTGRALPIRGLLSAEVKTESTLRTLHMTGVLKLTQGQFPANEWLPALEHREAEAEIDGNILRFSKLSARHALGDFSATGSLDFSKFDAPAFDLLIRGEKVRFNAGPLWAGSANLAVNVIGTREAASVSGGAEVVALETTPRPDFGALISSGNAETIRVPAPEISLQPPFDHWTYQFSVTTPAEVKIKGGAVAADLHFEGTGSPLVASGDVTFTGLAASTAFSTGNLESGTWIFGSQPTFIARLSGKFVTGGAMPAYEGHLFGTPEQITTSFAGVQPGNDELIARAFTPGPQPLPDNVTEIPVDRGPLIYNQALADALASKQAEAAASPTPAEATPPPPK